MDDMPPLPEKTCLARDTYTGEKAFGYEDSDMHAYARAYAEQVQANNPWRTAIDEALIVGCLEPIKEHESAKAALARLVAWEVQIALDPAVSPEAAALIEKGRLEATK